MRNTIRPQEIIPGITRVQSYYGARSYIVDGVEEDTEHGIFAHRNGPEVPAVKLKLRLDGPNVRGHMTERVPADANLVAIP